MKSPISSIAGLAVIALMALVSTAPAQAQDRVYRCGNEYTNQPKGRSDCKPVQGGNVTIVHGTRPAAPAAQPAARPAPTAKPTPASQAASAQQRARDADARAILEHELRQAQARQAELKAEYKDGQPDKLGPETRNHQKYLDRVANLEAAIARNQSDIEGIERELQRLPKP